jgi:hypothetical protein
VTQEIFTDTTIHIARLIHSNKIKQQINTCIAKFPREVTGLVVRQEFKRRLLSEARYLLNCFKEDPSFDEVQHRVNRLLDRYHGRKKQICLDTLTECCRRAHLNGPASANDLVDRAKSYLRTLLKYGMRDFDAKVFNVLSDSGCACSVLPIIEQVEYEKYDLGEDECTKMGKGCGIWAFLSSRRPTLQLIESTLSQEKNLTKELQAILTFIQEFLADSNAVAKKSNACTEVGDLLIALESSSHKDFFSMNKAESSVLCKALLQKLHVQPANPDNQPEELDFRQ